MERIGEYKRGSLCVFVCAFQALASVDSGGAWHSACQTVFVHILSVCVCVCTARGQVCALPSPPLTAVRNLPFSLLKAGETMEGMSLGMRAGGEVKL